VASSSRGTWSPQERDNQGSHQDYKQVEDHE